MKDLNGLVLVGLFVMLVYVLATPIFASCRIPRNPEFRFKGQTYVVTGLQGAGYTRQHRSPVYTLVVMAKEDTKKWTKE